MILMVKSENKPKILGHEAWKQALLSVPAHIDSDGDDHLYDNFHDDEW